ncbi:hypothetical protein [Streptomyces sp. NPDC051684]|uniref:hypothetical protein n=1 Tax=Streptomyces sp. NPDC051684 TaxID=3365670 RepID=UPI0037BD192B
MSADETVRPDTSPDGSLEEAHGRFDDLGAFDTHVYVATVLLWFALCWYVLPLWLKKRSARRSTHRRRNTAPQR